MSSGTYTYLLVSYLDIQNTIIHSCKVIKLYKRRINAMFGSHEIDWNPSPVVTGSTVLWTRPLVNSLQQRFFPSIFRMKSFCQTARFLTYLRRNERTAWRTWKSPNLLTRSGKGGGVVGRGSRSRLCFCQESWNPFVLVGTPMVKHSRCLSGPIDSWPW